MTSPMMLLKTPILMVMVLETTRIRMMIMITGQIQLNWPVELILEIAAINPQIVIMTEIQIVLILMMIMMGI